MIVSDIRGEKYDIAIEHIKWYSLTAMTREIPEIVNNVIVGYTREPTNMCHVNIRYADGVTKYDFVSYLIDVELLSEALAV